MKNKILNLPFKKLTSLFTAIVFFCNIIAPLPAMAQTTASRKVDIEERINSCYQQSPDTVEEFIKNCIPDDMYTRVTVGGRGKKVWYSQLDDKQLKTKINKVYFHRQLKEAQEFTEYLDTDLLFNEVLGSIYPGLTPEEIDNRYASDYEKMTEFMNTQLSAYSGVAMRGRATPREFFPAARDVVYYAIKKSDFIPGHPYFTQPANGEIGNLYKFYYLSMLNDVDSFAADLYPGDGTSADELAEEITTAHEALLNSGKQTLANIILEASGPLDQNYTSASVLAFRHPSTYDEKSSMINFIRALGFIVSMDLARQEGKEGISLINGRLTDQSLDKTDRCDLFLRKFESYLYNREHGNEEQAKKALRFLYKDSDYDANKSLGCLPDLRCSDSFGGKDFLEIEKQAKDYFSILRAHKYNYAWAYVNGVYQMQLLAATEVAPKFIKFLATIEKEISPEQFLSADSNGKSLSSIDSFLNQFKEEWDRELAADFKGTGLTWETFVAKIKEDGSLDKTYLMEQGEQSNVTFQERSENLAKSTGKLIEEHSKLHSPEGNLRSYWQAKEDVGTSLGSFFEYLDFRTLANIHMEDIDHAAVHAAQNLLHRLISLTYEVLEYQKHMMATGNGSERILPYYANELVHSRDYCANPDRFFSYTHICTMVDWTIWTFKKYKIANKITEVGYLDSTFLQNRNIINTIFQDSMINKIIEEVIFMTFDITVIFEGLAIAGKVAKLASTPNKVRKIVKAIRTANKVQDSLSVVNQSKKMLKKAKSWTGSNNITNKLNRLKKASNSVANVAQAEKVANAEDYLKQADALLKQADSYAAQAEKYLGEGNYLRADYYAKKAKTKGSEAAEFIDKAEDEVKVFQEQAKQRRKESALNNTGDARPATGNADDARHSANNADNATRGVGKNSTKDAVGGGNKAMRAANNAAGNPTRNKPRIVRKNGDIVVIQVSHNKQVKIKLKEGETLYIDESGQLVFEDGKGDDVRWWIDDYLDPKINSTHTNYQILERSSAASGEAALKAKQGINGLMNACPGCFEKKEFEKIGKIARNNKKAFFDPIFADSPSKDLAEDLFKESDEILGKKIYECAEPLVKKSVASDMARDLSYVRIKLVEAPNGGVRAMPSFELDIDQLLQRQGTFKSNHVKRTTWNRKKYGDPSEVYIKTKPNGKGGYSYTNSKGESFTISKMEYDDIASFVNKEQGGLYIDLGKGVSVSDFKGAVMELQIAIMKKLKAKYPNITIKIKYGRGGSHEFGYFDKEGKFIISEKNTKQLFINEGEMKHFHMEFEIIDENGTSIFYNTTIRVKGTDDAFQNLVKDLPVDGIFDSFTSDAVRIQDLDDSNELFEPLLISSYFIKEYDINGLSKNPLFCNNGRGFYFA